MQIWGLDDKPTQADNPGISRGLLTSALLEVSSLGAAGNHRSSGPCCFCSILSSRKAKNKPSWRPRPESTFLRVIARSQQPDAPSDASCYTVPHGSNR